MFALGVFGAYLAMGFGLSELLLGIGHLPKISVVLTWVIITFTFLLGIISLWDFLKAAQGRHSKITLKLPSSLRIRMNMLIAKQMRTRTLAVAALFLGCAISLLEFACTGQIYFPIIQFMNSVSVDRARTIVLLVVYNTAFVLPLIVIFVVAGFGVSSERLGKLLIRHLATTKLLMGVFLLTLGVLLIIFR